MLVAQSSLTLQPCGLQPARLLCPRNSPGKNTGVGSCSFLQGIFPTQGSNLNLLHCRQILYHLSHQTGKERQDNRFTLTPEKSKQTINCPSLLPERVSRLEQREEEMRWSQTDSLELWGWSRESANTRAERVCRTGYQRGES